MESTPTPTLAPQPCKGTPWPNGVLVRNTFLEFRPTDTPEATALARAQTAPPRAVGPHNCRAQAARTEDEEEEEEEEEGQLGELPASTPVPNDDGELYRVVTSDAFESPDHWQWAAGGMHTPSPASDGVFGALAVQSSPAPSGFVDISATAAEAANAAMPRASPSGYVDISVAAAETANVGIPHASYGDSASIGMPAAMVGHAGMHGQAPVYMPAMGGGMHGGPMPMMMPVAMPGAGMQGTMPGMQGTMPGMQGAMPSMPGMMMMPNNMGWPGDMQNVMYRDGMGCAGGAALAATGGNQLGTVMNPTLPPQPHTLAREYSTNSQCDRIRWTVDARKLKGNDKQAVSPPFALEFGGSEPVIFKMMIYPTVTNEQKGGAAFKKSKGRGYVQLKCEAELHDNKNAEILWRLQVGREKRGPVKHNFSQSAVSRLKGEECWDFNLVVDGESQTFEVILEVVDARYAPLS